MFDYQKWRKELLNKVSEFDAEGIRSSLHLGSDDSPKPGYSFGLFGANALGEFQNWITGETDYSIMKPASPDGKIVSARWGVVVSNDTFSALFDEFVAEFRKHDRGS